MITLQSIISFFIEFAAAVTGGCFRLQARQLQARGEEEQLEAMRRVKRAEDRVRELHAQLLAKVCARFLLLCLLCGFR